MAISKKKFSLENLKKTDQLVVRTGREKNVDRVIFPNPVEVGLDADTLRSTLTTHGGVKIPQGAPSEITNVLYNDNGVLKFNGQPVITGTDGIVHLARLGVTGSMDISGPLRVTGGIVTDDSNSEFIRAGDRIQVTKNGDGSYTITADVQSGAGGSSSVIAPFAYARLDSSSGTGVGLSYSTPGSAGTLSFVFDSAQSDTDYTVLTDGEFQDDGRLAMVSNKTTSGFQVDVYDGNGNPTTPSSASAFAIIVYGSTPTVSVSGGSAADAQYLTLAATSDLNNERVFTAGTGISVTDGGAGGAFTVSADSSVVPSLTTNNTFTGDLTVQGDIKGSVQKLSDGTTDFIQAGSNVTVTNNVDGSITVNATDTNTDTTYTAGSGLSLSTTTFSVDLQSGGGIRLQASKLAVNPSDIAGTGIKANSGNTALDIEPSGFAGTGLEDDGSDNLRISSAAAGSGLTGGGGSALSVDPDSTTGGNVVPVNVTASGVGLDVSTIAGPGTSADGSGNVRVDINTLSNTLTTGADSDLVAVSDADGSNVTKKMSLSNLKSYVNAGVTAYTAGDGLALSGAAFKQRAVITVTASGGNFLIDGQTRPLISAPKTLDYYFDLSDASMSGRLFALSTTPDGTHASGVQFTNGVTASGTPGTSGAYLEVKFTQEDPDVLYYYDGNTSGMGNKLVTGLGYLETDTATVTYAGKGIFPQGIQGSLQKLSDGTTDFIQAGDNITITNNPGGSITVSSELAGAFTAGDGIDIAAGVISTDLKAGGGLKITATELEVDDNVVAKLSGATFTGNITVPGAGGIRGSIQQLADGVTDFIQAGSNVTVTNNADGSITIASTGGSGSGSSGTIGNAEDGDYTDGLFTDFTTNTNVGTAVDRFNEVLKALAPDPAPNLSAISVTTSAVNAKLSFGSSNTLVGYTDVSDTAGLGSSVDTNGTYQSATSGTNVRIGVVSSGTVINGIVASNVTQNAFDSGEVNYPAESIGSGDQGSLQLWINGVMAKAISLADVAVGSGSPGSGTGTELTSGTGFVNVSATGYGKFSNGSSFEVFSHRTARFQVGVAAQRNGWNYAQVKHVVGSTTYSTNYVEWVVDETTDGTEPVSASSNSLTGLSTTGSKYLSGVLYNTGGTANYAVTVSNAYRDVYSTSNITFTGSSCTVPSQSFPALTGGEDSSKSLSVAAVATINDSKMLDEPMSVSISVPHPLRNNLTNAGASSISGILIYNISDSSSVLSENFSGESYRLQSGAYNNQSDVGSGTWNSTLSIIDPGSTNHVNGLMVYDEKLVSPTNAIHSGDFRNTAEGGNILNGPVGNVNYSGTTGTKTYYRRFTNNAGGSKTDFNLSMNTSGTTIVDSTGTLNTTNVQVSVKLPQTSDGFSTAWLDIKKSFATGQVGSDGDGCLVGTFDSSSNSTNRCTFGTQSAGNNEYIILRVSADESWTGNIDQISISWL